MKLSLDELHGGGLSGLSLTLEDGLHVVLGHDGAALDQLVGVAAGMQRCRGRVSLGATAPAESPELRRRIGCLREDEQLPPAGRVNDALNIALELRGDPPRADQLLEQAGLASWAARLPRDLSGPERRSLGLLLALSIQEPLLLALHEPLAATGGLSADWTLTQLRGCLQRGAAALCTTTSPRDASLLGGSLHVYEGGKIVRRPSPPLYTELAPGLPIELVVQSQTPRELAILLASDPAVLGLDWDVALRPHELVLRGADPDALALALAGAARRGEFSVQSITPRLPELPAVRGASAGLWRAAYDRAYQAALEQAPLYRPHAAATLPASSQPPAQAVAATAPNAALPAAVPAADPPQSEPLPRSGGPEGSA